MAKHFVEIIHVYKNISPKLISDPDSLSTLDIIGVYTSSTCDFLLLILILNYLIM